MLFQNQEAQKLEISSAFPVLKYSSNEIRTSITQFVAFFLAQPTYKSKKDGKNLWPKFCLDCWTAATAFGTKSNFSIDSIGLRLFLFMYTVHLSDVEILSQSLQNLSLTKLLKSTTLRKVDYKRLDFEQKHHERMYCKDLGFFLNIKFEFLRAIEKNCVY